MPFAFGVVLSAAGITGLAPWQAVNILLIIVDAMKRKKCAKVTAERTVFFLFFFGGGAIDRGIRSTK